MALGNGRWARHGYAALTQATGDKKLCFGSNRNNILFELPLLRQ
jgi:hypothetical protein